jgi:23S rRNA pseudouridine1911/1915/1917 synthase
MSAAAMSHIETPRGGIESITVAEPSRLDRLLAQRPSIGSREKARQALRSGKVAVDGVDVGEDAGGRILDEGARVEIAWNRRGSSAARTAGREGMDRAGVGVVWEDDDLIVCDKPSGLLTDSADADQAKHQDTLRKRVRAWTGRAVFPAHRIDRDTSGLVCFGKDERLREPLMGQWAERTPLRRYLALVEGRIDAAGGLFCDWMVWDGKALLQRPCRAGSRGGVLAEADWEVLGRSVRATLLAVRLRSGRRNQIRLHTRLAGHPLVGETLYRDWPPTVEFPRQALHAYQLGFRHPRDGRSLRFEAPVPADLRALLTTLRLPLSPPGEAP